MFKELLQILTDHGLLSAAIVLVLIVLFRYIMNMRSVWQERDRITQEESADVKKEELKNHPFFTNATFKINSEIPVMHLDASKPVRQQLFRDLIRHHFNSIYEHADKLVDEHEEDMTPQAWSFLVNEKLAEMDNDFQTNALAAGIPSIAVQKYLVWSRNTMNTISGYVNSLAVSTVYETNSARLNTFLFLLNLLLTTIMGDVHQAFDTLNGEVSGLEYQNSIVE